MVAKQRKTGKTLGIPEKILRKMHIFLSIGICPLCSAFAVCSFGFFRPLSGSVSLFMPFLHVPAKSGMSSQNEQSEFEFLNIFEIFLISDRSANSLYISFQSKGSESFTQ